MPLTIIRNDITKMQVDAIVNTANPRPVVGGGVDRAIHRAAGPELLAARQKIGDIATGAAFITPGYGLPSKSVIHTVGPVWRGGSLPADLGRDFRLSGGHRHRHGRAGHPRLPATT